ncbi:substrate-binding domain-containing protein [uncultured Megasphaera sp.]|uniref:substrate-binding domain-containing protein n=1 Tax=uncultured Megasphaera sp. TaxID=165188 RepID=UPI0025E8F807|nr:substrate-binding domain-containing protein [uncultured Megasphaera sp.]
MDEKREITRRTFLKSMLAVTAAAVLPKVSLADSALFNSKSLTVWSCGGLAETFTEVNAMYEKKRGVDINYTGAFAGALGKSLLGGSATTDVFAGRVLKLAQSLRKTGKMAYFKPLCFTEYVIVTPADNPAGIQTIDDLAKPGVRIILPLGASPPGGDAVANIIKNAGIDQAVRSNMLEKESCVIKMMPKVVKGTYDASIVERRLTTMPAYEGKVHVVPIDEKFFPPGPRTFTIGVMNLAPDRALADDYVNFLCDKDAQDAFQRHGFIPAYSPKGKLLIEKFGVKD